MRNITAIVTVLTILSLFFVGCGLTGNSSTGGYVPNDSIDNNTNGNGSSGSLDFYAIEPKVVYNSVGERRVSPSADKFWINPGKVVFDNVEPGNTLSTLPEPYFGQPIAIQLHNGGRTTENKLVTNEKNDPEVVITLHDYMYEIDVNVAAFWKLLDDPSTTDVNEQRTVILNGKHYLIEVISSVPNEDLRVIDYDALAKQITVIGLIDPLPIVDDGITVIPDTMERVVSVIYTGTTPRAFELEYVEKPALKVGYDYAPYEAKNWITITQTTFMLETFESVVVPISMIIPDSVLTPSRWQVTIACREYSPLTEIGVSFLIEYNYNWLITMK